VCHMPMPVGVHHRRMIVLLPVHRWSVVGHVIRLPSQFIDSVLPGAGPRYLSTMARWPLSQRIPNVPETVCRPLIV
jgi:hypothetical protein